MSSGLSLCVPRTHESVGWQLVKEVFEGLLGAKNCVQRVDVVHKTAENGEPFVRLFVHIRFFPNNDDSHKFRDAILHGNSVNVVYDDPWYWKCSLSRAPKPNPQRNSTPTKPYFKINSSTDTHTPTPTHPTHPTPPPSTSPIPLDDSVLPDILTAFDKPSSPSSSHTPNTLWAD